jgi:antitoxin component YwqK of YwqJK toxin-antitoxin module
MARTPISAVILATIVAVALPACSSKPDKAAEKNRFNPVYDKTTGKLTMLKFDSKKDGKIDTWSYMDGTRIVRIEIDRDGDGKVDRWEYYGADQKVEKIGLSRANDGLVDAWAYAAPDGSVAKMEISTNRDGKVTRTEYYEGGVISRVEEDTKGTGRIDKWETYRNGSLSMVAFDDQQRGTPTRRLVYLGNGKVLAEVDPKGDGNFVRAPAK